MLFCLARLADQSGRRMQQIHGFAPMRLPISWCKNVACSTCMCNTSTVQFSHSEWI